MKGGFTGEGVWGSSQEPWPQSRYQWVLAPKRERYPAAAMVAREDRERQDWTIVFGDRVRLWSRRSSSHTMGEVLW